MTEHTPSPMEEAIADYTEACYTFLLSEEWHRLAQSDLQEAQRRAEHASRERLQASQKIHSARMRYEAAAGLTGQPFTALRVLVDEEVAQHDAHL